MNGKSESLKSYFSFSFATMSLFTKGDLVVDQHGKHFIVVDEPGLGEAAPVLAAQPVTLPVFMTAVDALMAKEFFGEAAPVPAAQPDIWPVFMTAGDALMKEE